jgi:hypothetical protein
MLSQGKIWSISLTLLARCDLLSFVDDFRVGSAIVLGTFENEVGEKYKEFQDATFFLNRSKMR